MAQSPEIDYSSDPRVTGKYVRRVPGGPGELTLVGVVHDHPSSTYRVRRVVEELDPDVLALELPPISIPLFERYAATDRRPPAFGGEMSAAIQAAAPDTAVGIDRPTGGFFRRLGRRLLAERPSLETARTVLSNVVSTTKHALACRAAAALACRTSIQLAVDSPQTHDIDWTDSPADQARDEREQVSRSRSFANAFRTASRTRAAQLEDAAREAEMATQLAALRADGTVVAVVGIDHLDSLRDRLDPTATVTR